MSHAIRLTEQHRLTKSGRQAAIGLLFAFAITGSWLLIHIYGIYRVDLANVQLLLTAALVLLQTWLTVGLFIIAHDAMHGSLVPGRLRANRFIGKLALLLYAGFDYDRLIIKHFQHHKHSGSADDPDFDANHPRSFWPWFVTFFGRYFGWRELLFQAVVANLALFVFQAKLANLLLFWAVPALAAAVQLFYFGTYRQHRHGDVPFVDRHNARSDDFPPWLSLLTCFHFGYHHEHHEAPHLPWWKLPSMRHNRALP